MKEPLNIMVNRWTRGQGGQQATACRGAMGALAVRAWCTLAVLAVLWGCPGTETGEQLEHGDGSKGEPTVTGSGTPAAEEVEPVSSTVSTGSQQPCDPSAPACPEDEYCKTSECDAPTGRCEAYPQLCAYYYSAVCGCDGYEYGNACGAAAVGVSVDYFGACEDKGAVCGDDLGEVCGADEFCDRGHAATCAGGACELALCGGPGVEGHCRALPTDCPDKGREVCGCDGVTYANFCEAHAQGMSVVALASCEGLNSAEVLEVLEGDFVEAPSGVYHVLGAEEAINVEFRQDGSFRFGHDRCEEVDVGTGRVEVVGSHVTLLPQAGAASLSWPGWGAVESRSQVELLLSNKDGTLVEVHPDTGVARTWVAGGACMDCAAGGMPSACGLPVLYLLEQ